MHRPVSPLLHDYKPPAEKKPAKSKALQWFIVGLGIPLGIVPADALSYERAHALATDPLSLFHGNILHPAPYSLARSEHMLGHQPLFAPIYAASENPVLAVQMNISNIFSGLAINI